MEANWKPLENRLGRERCVGLDDEGICYIATGSKGYRCADFEFELKKLEGTLQGLHATLQTPYDDVFVAQKREASRQQGISLLSVQIEPQEIKVH